MKSEMRHETESAVVARGAIAVGLVAGGACGSLVRLALSALQPATAAWPWMTTVINLTGAFLLGCITAYMAVLGPDIGIWKVMRLSLGTGLIGGYTTYSTLMLEVAKRLENGKAGIALAYLLVSVVVGLVCALLGFAAGRSIGEWHVRRIATRNGDTREGASSGRESADDASSSSEPDRGPLQNCARYLPLRGLSCADSQRGLAARQCVWPAHCSFAVGWAWCVHSI
ncbi:CrcB family protein [Bifidobacterium sp. ESL0682]|uniref:fluoride efflux transporter FluC n=1 Tax=Bifidobacterium sp. ESL0682 TaxID=2983212 RepID=UPI0023F84256|nr:CrcB family protein [Bifidobacterium sp. ESL0682]WEV41661.1 CrcB family protein [Bifidobacterium sp. ESL0682]